MKKNYENQIKSTNVVIIKAFLIALVIFSIFVFVLPKSYIANFINIGYFDRNAKDISELKSMEDIILEELQKYADASNFSIEMNAKMVFQSALEPGTVHIANPENNNFNMTVGIYVNDTKELVYRTGVLKPGDYIEKDSLRMFLEKGVYPATAVIDALEPNTNDVIGRVELDTVIYVLE